MNRLVRVKLLLLMSLNSLLIIINLNLKGTNENRSFSPFNFAALSSHQLLILLLTSVICVVGPSGNTFLSFHIFRIEMFLI
jgi:hypothetical protein